jgi:hypothetical protein
MKLIDDSPGRNFSDDSLLLLKFFPFVSGTTKNTKTNIIKKKNI